MHINIYTYSDRVFVHAFQNNTQNHCTVLLIGGNKINDMN